MIDIKRKDGTIRHSVEFSDSSLYRKELMVEEYAMLYFSTDSIVRFSKGDYIETEFGKFEIVTVNRPKENTSTGGYDYEQRFDGFMEKLKTRILFYDRQNNKECTWKLTQKPSAFLDIVCSNIKTLGWGQYSYSVDASLTEMKNINFDSTSIFDALTAIAEAWGVEWWIDDDMTIHLSKCEHGESVTLALDNELVDMDRSEGSSNYATRLYAFGSTRNIPTNYRGASSGSTIQGVVEKRLKLPAGIDYVDAWENMADEDVVETVVNFDEIYPKRIGSISELSTKQYTDNVENTDGNSTTETWNAYRFKDNGITFSKNYIIPGQELRIVFQTGALAGMDFAVSFEPNTDGASGSGSQVWEIVRNEDYGINLPNDSLKPQVGDTYVLYGFDIALVATTYVPAAEQELLVAARAHIQKICIENATFTCNTNPIKCAGYVENEKGELVFAAGNVVDLGVGQKVMLSNDNQFGRNGFSSRIFAVEKLLCNKFSCKYSVGGTAKYSRLTDIENKAVGASDSADKNKEEIRSSKKKLIDFTNRRFRDIQETTKLLEQSLLNFSGSINPMSVKAMQLLIGDESLQFRFVDSKTSPKAVIHNITFNNATKRLFAPTGILQHLTLGIKNISPTHAANEYRYWDMSDFTSSYLTDGTKPYYLYAEVDKVNENGVFVLSEVPVGMGDVSGKYYLLVGILNSEFEGERSFVTLYGYSEILPGRITTEKIVSPSGETFIDLVNDIIQGKMTFKSGSSGLPNFAEFPALNSSISSAQSTATSAASTASAASSAASSAVGAATEAKEKVDNLKVGGVNLFMHTSLLYETKWVRGGAVFNGDETVTLNSSSNSSYIQNDNYRVSGIAGQTYTISFKTRTSITSGKGLSLYVFYDGGFQQVIAESIINNSTDFKVFSYTFTPSSSRVIGVAVQINGSSTNSGYAIIKHIKLEVGTIATDWSLNPKDIEADAQAKADAAKAAAIAAAAADAQSKIENLQIGGPNLFPYSDFENGAHVSIDSNCVIEPSPFDGGLLNAKNGTKVLYLNRYAEDSYWIFNAIPVEPNTTYTMSYWYISAGALNAHSSYSYLEDANHTNVGFIGSGQNPVQTNKLWVFHKFTFTTPSNAKYFYFRFGFHSSSYSWSALDCLKLEIGNYATAWCSRIADIVEDYTAKLTALSYLKTALQNDTSINGGLVSTTIVKVGAQSINGTWVEKCGINGAGTGDSTVRLWAGGTLQEAVSVASGGSNSHMTVITEGGKLFAVNAEISGKVNADSGVIGGFKINAGSMESNGSWNGGRFVLYPSDGFIAFLNTGVGVWAGIGANVFPASSGLRAVARFENCESNTWGLNVGLYVKVQNGAYNHAIKAIGAVVSDGLMTSYNLVEFWPSSAQNTLPIKQGVNFLVNTGNRYQTVYFPTREEVTNALGISLYDTFAVRILIVAYRNNPVGYDVYAPSGCQMINVDGGTWDHFAMGGGDNYEFMLIARNSGEYYAQVLNRWT